MHANWLNGPRKWCYQYVAFYSKVKQESCNENISPLIWIAPFIFFRVLSCRQNDIHKKVVNSVKEPLSRCCESVIHDQLSCNSRISWCNPVVFAQNIIFIICVVINVSIFFIGRDFDVFDIIFVAQERWCCHYHCCHQKSVLLKPF